MSSTYNGNAGGVSLGSGVSITIPSDGDPDSAASVNVPFQKGADYLEAMRLSPGLSEGFDSVTFPPTTTPGWTSPSARFGSDLAWVRTTTGFQLLSGGTVAQAAAPSPQGTSTNSSLGLSALLLSPSRVGFYFTVKCNITASDHLDFYVDGVLTAQWNCTATTAQVTGRFHTDVLKEGVHTFDWRFVRGGSASIASEIAAIDMVEILPESKWFDRGTRIEIYDEMAYPATIGPFWVASNSGNAGSIAGLPTGSIGQGLMNMTAAAVAIGDWQAATGQIFVVPSATFSAFFEANIILSSLANIFVMFGIWAGSPTGANMVAWLYDSSISANWILKAIDGATVTKVNEDSGVAAITQLTRLGLFPAINSTSANLGLVSGMINGKAVPGAGKVMGGAAMGSLGAVTNVQPFFLVGSRVAAAAKSWVIDSFRYLTIRNASGVTGSWA